MTDMIRNLRRREPRYQIVNDRGLTVTVQKTDGSSQPLQVELVNLSASGAKFKTAQPVAAREVMAVKIHVDQPTREMTVSGEVVWVAPSQGNEWLIGCTLDPPIPESTLQDFAQCGILDRREHVREVIDVPAVVRWELDKATSEVRLTNYSPGGGFCMQSACSCRTGERLLVQIMTETGREVLVPANARWQVQADDHFVIGCEFVRPKDSSLISEVISSHPSYERTPMISKMWSPSWLFGRRPLTSRLQAKNTLTRLMAAATLIAVIFAAFAAGRWWYQPEPTPIVTRSIAAHRNPLATNVAPMTESVEFDGASAFYVAESHFLRGNYEQAIEALKVAVRHDPGNPISIYLLALTHFQMNRMELAERCVAKGAELEGSRPIYAWEQAMVHFTGPSRTWLDEARRIELIQFSP